ncbi:MAG: hypothetical protein H0U95_05195 [Bacteroidetes bacterium]|nr:hypothetical protein [Bacteroidota bacterium]
MKTKTLVLISSLFFIMFVFTAYKQINKPFSIENYNTNNDLIHLKMRILNDIKMAKESKTSFILKTKKRNEEIQFISSSENPTLLVPRVIINKQN